MAATAANSRTSLIEARVCDGPGLESELSRTLLPKAKIVQESEPRSTIAWVRATMLACAALFFALHFVHLSADFPNHSPWMDWSKYTDEGWYGDAAIRQIQRGHWYVPGDFNPAAAMPVWPLLEYGVFAAAGVSLVAARALAVAVFGGILLAGYLLLRRYSGSEVREPLAPEAAVLMLSVSPFCYVFTRLAILEPLLILIGLLALLAASSLPAGSGDRGLRPTRRLSPSVAALGLLIPLMVLTKTTAVFLLPSILWMVWSRCGYRLRPFVRACLPVATIAAVLWTLYFGVVVRPRFLDDYRYLFSANAYTGITWENWREVVANTFKDGMWMGSLMYPVAVAAVIGALFSARRTLRNPLVPSLMLWAVGYASFLAYHNNLQPRYYLVIAVPLMLLVPLVAELALRGGDSGRQPVKPPARRMAAGLAVCTLTALAVLDARQTVRYVKTPEYTYARAAQEVRKIVQADPRHNPLILSISGSDLSLMTGLPSICDDFGTMTLEDRVARYKPGWYATWNEVDDDKMDALAPLFHLERVAAFPALDDPERNLLILYRLDPPQPETGRKRRRKQVPKLLETKMGQQPTAMQLEH